MFREGTNLDEIKSKFAFVYNAGGIGDYINWTTAIQYAIETHTWLSGYVVTPPHFEDLARLWFKNYSPRFEVIVSRVGDFSEMPELQGVPSAIPNREQYANACGFSLFDLGFAYFNQISKIPQEWKRLPRITGTETSIDKFNLPAHYAVITPAATADNRRLSTHALNELNSFLVERNIQPVLLGKYDVAPDHKGVSADLITEGTLDLRDKTSLTEAACIMARAKFVIGLDGGLLHLACCSSVPVAIAFTTADPALRVPPRTKDARTLILVPPPSLGCRFCQTQMKFVMGHDFKRCLYGDNICVESFNGKLLIDAAEKLISLNGNKV